MIIVFIGPPGSGKGTQAHILAAKLDLQLVSIGEVLRKHLKEETVLGRSAYEYVSQGKLVPVEIVNSIIQNTLKDHYSNFILDGYPRNLDQAKFLDEINKEEKKIIYFSIDKDIIKKRILGRYNCSKCGRIYNEFFSKPIINETCDNCLSKCFVYRDDDNEEVLNKRIEEYKLETCPLIEYYNKHQNIFEIDASQTKTSVTSILENLMENLLKH